MTVNLKFFVDLFDDFKERTPWWVKVLTGLSLGVIVASGISYAFFAPDTQPAVAAVSSTATLIPSPTQTPAPTETLPPTVIPPTPTVVPIVHLIWSDQATAVNMRDEPSGNVISAVANGQSVVLANEVEESGGYTWVRVAFGNKEGWMANFLIWEVEGKYRLLEDATKYYDAQNGAYAGSFPKGTPYKVISEEEGWTQILLPDEKSVWIEK